MPELIFAVMLMGMAILTILGFCLDERSRRKSRARLNDLTARQNKWGSYSDSWQAYLRDNT